MDFQICQEDFPPLAHSKRDRIPWAAPAEEFYNDHQPNTEHQFQSNNNKDDHGKVFVCSTATIRILGEVEWSPGCMICLGVSHVQEKEK